MSAFIISGFFSLTSGRRIRTDVARPNGTSQGVYYVHYETIVQCSQSGPISAELRKYSPPGESVLQNDTIAYVVAKAYMPPPNMPRTFLLEAIHIAPEPGDPSSDDYEDSVPDFPFPSFFIQGTVSEEHKVDEGGIVNFPVNVSDYVRGNNKKSTVTYVLLLFFYYCCDNYNFAAGEWTRVHLVGKTFLPQTKTRKLHCLGRASNCYQMANYAQNWKAYLFL